jgi:4-hydroxyacetophenone monooxygenase
MNDGADLDRTLEHADLRVLLMCLVHLTGNRKWIEAPFTPRRDVRLVPDPQAGFDSETAAAIRTAIRKAMHNGGRPQITDPGEALLSEMMNVCLGEVVPPEYLPMVRADMGFDPAWPEWSSSQPESLTDRASGSLVLVIGAGLSGMCAALRLRALGVPFRIVEKNSGVGGTWFENRYPGCGVDTPNHFYSYSFAPNHDWDRNFSPQPEILEYLNTFASTQGLSDLIEYNTEVKSMTWNEPAARWQIVVNRSTQDAQVSETIEATAVISAIGHFNKPVVAPFTGSDEFEGQMFHSARWPQGLDVTNKRVAIIGTGASSMQIVPTIADSVCSLTIFQRSAQWARNVPGLNDPVRPDERHLLHHLPYYAAWTRFTQFWRYGDGLLRFLKKDPDWPHPDRSLNRINDRHREEMTNYITDQLADRPELIEKCLPTYPPYGKRILLDKGWFAALKQPHVALVTDAIDRLDQSGVIDSTGTHHDADIVVIATGFSVTDLAARLNIIGREGRTLAEDWANDNPHAHIGITVPGFPNLFLMGGPNTNAGHGGSGFLMAEAQTRYITSCLIELFNSGRRSMDVRPEVREEYIQRVDAEHETLVWTHPGMSTYYRNKSGRVVSPMPFRLVDYWHAARAVNPAEFQWA